MKYIEFGQHGNPQQLNLKEKSLTLLDKSKMRIKVIAAGVNYSDVLIRQSSNFFPVELPYILGSEASGEIVEIGQDVSNEFKVGDYMLCMLFEGGGYSEYIDVNPTQCIKLSSKKYIKEVTASFVQGATAYLILNSLMKNPSSGRIFINGASGGVGQILVQLSKHMGLKVIAGSSRYNSNSSLKDPYNFMEINYSEKNWISDVMDKSNGVDFITDMIGGKHLEDALNLLKPGGKIVHFGMTSGESLKLDLSTILFKNFTVEGFTLGHYIGNQPSEFYNAVKEIIDCIENDEIEIAITEFPFEDVVKAHEAIEQNNTKGKVVLVP